MRRYIAIVLGLAVVGGMAAHRGAGLVTGPESSLLVSEGGAEWIRREVPPSPLRRQVRPRRDLFRRDFTLSETPEKARLVVRAFRSVTVSVNGRRIHRASDELDLAPFLRRGGNSLVIAVKNEVGPPAVLVHSEDLGISTPEGWRVTADGSRWNRATLAAERSPVAISGEFPSALESLARKLPFAAAFFLVGAVGGVVLVGRVPAHRARWLLSGAWIALCANNLWKIPHYIGFDVHGHYAYIAYIVEKAGLPLATDGWEMFQSPLFYLLAALPSGLLSGLMESEDAERLLRVLPMLCGLAQIEIAFRSSRIVFPGRDDLQIVGAAVGGFLPVNIYMSQVVGNEPLCGCLVALLILCAFALLAEPSKFSLPKSCVTLGLVFGLALLAKVSASVMLPAMLLLILYLSHLRGSKAAEVALSTAAFLLSSGVVAGWYYIRNWFWLGKPFVGNWSRGLRLEWWQDPGYRVPGDFLSFGESLIHPVYSSFMGFWDGIYSSLWLDGFLSGIGVRDTAPPWNYEFMLALALLSIPLAMTGLVGVGLSFRRPRTGPERVRSFAVICVGSYLTALVYMFLAVPIYSVFKSSFALGVIPCAAVLIASGVSRIPRGAISRGVVFGYLCCWLAFAYIAHFVW